MKRIARSILSFLLCATGSVLFAQQPVNHSAPAVKPAAPVPAATPPAPVVDPSQPVLSNLQMVEFDDYETHINAIVQSANIALQPWQSKRQALIQEIQAANPGFTWQEPRGNEPGRWVKTPPPAAPAPETPKK